MIRISFARRPEVCRTDISSAFKVLPGYRLAEFVANPSHEKADAIAHEHVISRGSKAESTPQQIDTGLA
nr:hypothetical protein [Olsenella sp. KH3B4]